MAQGLYTPLQLTAIAGMLANQGLKSIPTSLSSAITAFNSTALITNFLNAINYYVAQSWATESTLAQLQSLGASTCPALGNSIPAADINLTPVLNPSGFSGLVSQTANAYLGTGDYSKFAQGFTAVQGYLDTTNKLINSTVNAQTYLGPTFTGMDALTTNSISNINSDFAGFGTDLANQGQLTNLSNIENYGTPAALLQQLSAVGRIQGGTLQGVQTQLVAAGLTVADIKTLLNRPTTMADYEFDQLQRLAYTGMTAVRGTDLQTVLDILDVTTPGIETMADLLNQQKIFPNSWRTLNAPSPAGPVPVYLNDGSVNMQIEPTVSTYLPTATGCEDLGKVVTPAVAVANKAVQTSLQQVTGITGTTLPALAQTVLGNTPNTWNNNSTYLPNAVVSYGAPIPTVYRAQQYVPPGVNITDTDYWLPTDLGGLSTMAGLPDIQSQTQPLAPAVASYFSTSLATGTGVNGTITTCDVIGLAIDYNNISAQLNAATAAINSLNGLGALNALKATYVSMASAANDAAMLVLIGTANAQIAAVVAAQPALTTALNTAYGAVASMLNSEKGYQNAAGIDYFALQDNSKPSIFSFVQLLPRYALQTESCGPCEFLNTVADVSNLYGQAIVGTMREGQNSARLNAARLDLNTTPSVTPEVIPIPAVTPVY